MEGQAASSTEVERYQGEVAGRRRPNFSRIPPFWTMDTMGRILTANQSPRDPHKQPGVLKGSHPQTPLPGDRDNGKRGFPPHSEPPAGLGRQDIPHSSSLSVSPRKSSFPCAVQATIFKMSPFPHVFIEKLLMKNAHFQHVPFWVLNSHLTCE